MLDKSKCDEELGTEIELYLKEKGASSPIDYDVLQEYDDDEKIAIIGEHFQDILVCLGLDILDDSIMDTSTRLAKMYVNEIFWGLNSKYFPKCSVFENKMQCNEMVVERDINVQSFCEHHFVNIGGFATVAYIPKKKIIGLSKINRVVEYFSRRPQVQERLTAQIFYALEYILQTKDIAVTITADHLCVKARGVEDIKSKTTTTKVGGTFKENPASKAEFLKFI